MTINFNAAMNYSWMSQASYLDLSGIVAGDTTGLVTHLKESLINNDKILADKQAVSFTNSTNGYSFISQLPNTPNGTSVTAFKSNENGSYTIAVRGTEPGPQFELKGSASILF